MFHHIDIYLQNVPVLAFDLEEIEGIMEGNFYLYIFGKFSIILADFYIMFFFNMHI